MRFSLKTRLLLVIGLLGIVPIVGVGLHSYNLGSSRQAGEQMDTAWRGAQALARINGLVYAVVMESRGIYMSADWKQAAPFAKNLLRDLDEIDAVTNQWKENIVESERSRIDDLPRAIAQFIAFARSWCGSPSSTTPPAPAPLATTMRTAACARPSTMSSSLSTTPIKNTPSTPSVRWRYQRLNQDILIGLAGVAAVALAAGFLLCHLQSCCVRCMGCATACCRLPAAASNSTCRAPTGTTRSAKSARR